MHRFRRPVALFVTAAAFSVPTALRADDVTIEFFTNSFVPQAVSVEVGDVVSFVWRRGDHVLASGAPEDADAGSVFDVPLTEENPLFEFTIGVDQLGGFTFFDRNRPAQLGFVEVTGGEQQFRVGVVDNVYLPEFLYIFEGDAVLWEHEFMEDFHTVTSGASSDPADEPGALFDVESSCAEPIFVYTFEAADTYPYFCRPHERMGMTGVVYVQHRFVRGDSNGNEIVDISDAIGTLGFLFLGNMVNGCDDALDANDDSQIDITDAVFTLSFLFLGGVEIPRPVPLKGADRTDDDLLCLDL
ncbi:MAG: plastocyanin/azurin family copper-binding protein [Planctomycetota bacterium]